MKEVENILRILKETQKAIQINDFTTIKNLSNQTINTASLTQDPDNIAVAVIIYSIGKIFEREHYKTLPNWNKFYSTLKLQLDKSIKDVENNDEEKFRQDFMQIRESINKISGKLSKYIKNVFDKASINKASRIYEHGVSMEQTAKLLGITMFDLANYAGGQQQTDTKESQTLSAKQRIKLIEEFFG